MNQFHFKYFSKQVGLTMLLVLLFSRGVSAQTAGKLDSLFITLAKDGYLNGCVLVAEAGKPLYEKAFGFSNFDTKQLLDTQTMFELASVSKQFTAMAIMQLHQQGKLEYSDAVVNYLPDLPYREVSISQLLHHTSGIPEFLGWNEKQVATDRINGNRDILAALVKNKPELNFKTGDQLAYSNTNYVLLALIVEKISGLSFGGYLDRFIFKPLGMLHTAVYPQRSVKQKIADYAYGYLYNPAKGGFDLNDHLAANRYEYYFDGVAGPYGISSNVGDMLKWDQALYSEQLVSKAIQDEAYATSRLNDGKEAKFAGIPYGFGWLIMPSSKTAGRRYMHSGGYPGYMSMIVRYPDQHKTIILLTNIYNVINLYELTAAVENILFDRPFKIPAALPFQKSLTLTPGQLKAVEGVYIPKVAPQMRIIISTENGQVYAQLSGQPRVEIYAEGELDFFYTLVAAKIKFAKDDSGKITGLTLLQNGQMLEAEREK